MKKPQSLAGVVTEVLDLLLANDYGRYESKTGAFYYVFGETARATECEGETFPNYTGVHHDDSYVDDWQALTVLAAKAPDYLDRLRALGVDPELCAAMEGAARSDDPRAALARVTLEWVPRLPPERQREFGTALDAAVAALGSAGKLELPEADRASLRRAFERRFLREMAQKYPQVIERACGMAQLSVADPQLQEATRCFLYGFYRAAVLVCGAVVEAHLKRVSGVQRFEGYRALVASVYGPQGACPDAVRRSQLDDMFIKARNAVAHQAQGPKKEEAQSVLYLAREIVEHLEGWSSQSVG